MKLQGLKTIKIIFIFAFILVGRPLKAKETWIQSVGINTSLWSQNFSFFYAESANFIDACHKSSTRDCKAFMNADSKYAEDSQFLKRNNALPKAGLETPTRKSVLKAFENAIVNAGPNDKILLALHNHGAPGNSLQEGPTCIYLDQNEKICTADLEKILVKKPKNTKVAIICDGCFSGGCVNLSQADVCTAVTSDQYLEGFASWRDIERRDVNGNKIGTSPTKDKLEDIGFFGPLVKGKPHNFSDLRSNSTLGSETMIRNRCDEKFSKIFVDFHIGDIKAYLSFQTELSVARFNVSNNHCSNYEIHYQNFPTLKKFVQNTNVQLILDRLCADQKDEFDAQICNESKKMAADGNEAIRKYTDFMSTLELKKIYKEELDRAFADIQELPSVEAAAAQQEVINMKGGKDSNAVAEKVSPSAWSKIKTYAGALKGAYDRYRSSDQKSKELDELMKKQYAESNEGINGFLRSCMQTVDKSVQPWSRGGYWQRKALQFPKRNFTAKEIKQAQECEKSFTF